MTDYKTIFGKKIKFLTSDLSAAEAEGEVFYSDTDSKFKTTVATGVWSSSAPIITATRGIANTGTQTASVAYGGYTSTHVATTLEYNGSGWSSGENMPASQSEKTVGKDIFWSGANTSE